MNATRIIVFAKAPQPGRVKTRLIPALGEAGASRLAEWMLHHALETAWATDIGPVELCIDSTTGSADWHGSQLPPGVETSAQGEGDLGARMARAARRSLDSRQRVLLIGTDCPQLDAQTLRDAALLLDTHHAVMHPAHDGGYVLLGLSIFHSSLFADMPWGTSQVAALTRERFAALGWRTAIGRPLADIDEPANLVHLPPGWQRALNLESTS
ncbi:TIGR04282 family arsenosugar biosynthesis glycosyltransferase [Thiobacillus sp.]|uniref:TIGR04282 family arsenosugar biosynthesis glycosyltransferase n=1 Tax=Thiobacillus sp. TaxID=924 RepID=UPI0011D6960B|nr:TIGR04282 family arsenosugar biosynthesis glycosyltransferase [Thiobacillus sp.]TXH74004.1 MAG: glycosyltransferase [Thiobacillus sp.]